MHRVAGTMPMNSQYTILKLSLLIGEAIMGDQSGFASIYRLTGGLRIPRYKPALLCGAREPASL